MTVNERRDGTVSVVTNHFIHFNGITLCNERRTSFMIGRTIKRRCIRSECKENIENYGETYECMRGGGEKDRERETKVKCVHKYGRSRNVELYEL